MIYIKSIVIISPNNSKFLAISIYVYKDLFNILPLSNSYKNTILKLKKKKIKHSHNKSTTIQA